ncbi:MAG: 4-diphosphocytidyl-2-C-methyl-D-erythritol kinase [Bacteroidota bacterium]|jgi:4-diphosphocytidyl-2-C-methyl-D-erythritol kinase
MIIFPNAKVNFGLNIISKRADGFHNIQSVFVPVKVEDALEFIPANALQFSTSGLPIPGNTNDNLIIKAYHLIKSNYNIPFLKIHLHKVIPMGAGLGGGSADAVFFIKSVNNYFELKMNADEMLQIASSLGSDCAFFITNKISFATEKGENLEPFTLDLSGYKICVIHPKIHVNTAWAYSKIKPLTPNKSIKEILKQPIETWKNELINDFEKPVFEKHPEIQNLKNEFYKHGALYASMSGSGSAVFGIFKNEIPTLTFQQNFTIFNCSF